MAVHHPCTSPEPGAVASEKGWSCRRRRSSAEKEEEEEGGCGEEEGKAGDRVEVFPVINVSLQRMPCHGTVKESKYQVKVITTHGSWVFVFQHLLCMGSSASILLCFSCFLKAKTALIFAFKTKK